MVPEIRLTTQHVGNHVNNEIFTISTGAGFLNHQQYQGIFPGGVGGGIGEVPLDFLEVNQEILRCDVVTCKTMEAWVFL